MRNIFVPLLLTTLIGLGVAQPARSQTSQCGSPPPVENSELKGAIDSKAQFLSKFLGDASLNAHIDDSRTEIFSHYRDAEERSKAFFQYEICVLIMQDTHMTTEQKIDKLSTLPLAFLHPIVSQKIETRDGPNINFGCGDTSSSSVNYGAPKGFHIVSANASVMDADGTKASSAVVTSQTSTSATAVATFQGRNKDWTGNCPGGGHGAVRIAVDLSMD